MIFMLFRSSIRILHPTASRSLATIGNAAFARTVYVPQSVQGKSPLPGFRFLTSNNSDKKTSNKPKRQSSGKKDMGEQNVSRKFCFVDNEFEECNESGAFKIRLKSWQDVTLAAAKKYNIPINDIRNGDYTLQAYDDVNMVWREVQDFETLSKISSDDEAPPVLRVKELSNDSQVYDVNEDYDDYYDYDADSYQADERSPLLRSIYSLRKLALEKEVHFAPRTPDSGGVYVAYLKGGESVTSEQWVCMQANSIGKNGLDPGDLSTSLRAALIGQVGALQHIVQTLHLPIWEFFDKEYHESGENEFHRIHDEDCDPS